MARAEVSAATPACVVPPLADAPSQQRMRAGDRSAPKTCHLDTPCDSDTRAPAHQVRDDEKEARAACPPVLEVVLGIARTLVAQGAYADARERLEAWITQHGKHDRADGSDAHEGLAALLAGPFDAPAAAALHLDAAIARRPSDVRLRARLADLLLRVPERHDEAIRRHRELLAHEPTRRPSIEALRRLAALRGAVSAESDARATLNALGIGPAGSACERIATSIPIAHGLEQPVGRDCAAG